MAPLGPKLTTGMSQPGIFRLAGDGTRISHLTKVFNMPPLYGDSLSISTEPIHNLTGLVKRYVRDMPEPILDESIFPAFMTFCLDPAEDVGNPTLSTPAQGEEKVRTTSTARPIEVRIAAAQILLRLLPPSHFSLFIYLLAFLGQLPLFPDNRLNVESISIIFGPAMVAARGRGIAGLGPNSNSNKNRENDDPEVISEMVNSSQSVLGWLLRHWGLISEKVLDSISGTDVSMGMSTSASFSRDKLMAPINLKMSSVMPSTNSSSSIGPTPFAIPPPPAHDPPSPIAHNAPRQSRTPISTPKLDSTDSADSSSTGHSEPTATPNHIDRPISPAPSASGRTGGLFSRAFSSRNISAQANDDDPTADGKMKRSTSFTSISSMVKKTSGVFSKDPKGANLEGKSAILSQVLADHQPLDHCQLRN